MQSYIHTFIGSYSTHSTHCTHCTHITCIHYIHYIHTSHTLHTYITYITYIHYIHYIHIIPSNTITYHYIPLHTATYRYIPLHTVTLHYTTLHHIFVLHRTSRSCSWVQNPTVSYLLRRMKLNLWTLQPPGFFLFYFYLNHGIGGKNQIIKQGRRNKSKKEQKGCRHLLFLRPGRNMLSMTKLSVMKLSVKRCAVECQCQEKTLSLLGQFLYWISLKNVVDVKLIYVTTFSISICIGFD